MKNLVAVFALVSVLFSFAANAKVYYCSPTGSDSNPGTIDKPFATWEKLASVLLPGDTGYVRGGTYRTTKGASAGAHCRLGNKSGTSSSYIKLWAYPGETPVFNLDNIVSTGTSSMFVVILENASYWHIKGLRVTNFIQRNGNQHPFGFYMTGGTGNIIEQCESDHNAYGFSFDKQVNCLVKNCDAHHNQDPLSPSPYDGSDGFGSNGGQPSNVSITFDGCRSWWNCDDGWDLYRNDGMITFNNCWAFWNGYIPGTFTQVGNGDGFKVGPTDTDFSGSAPRRFLTRCVSFQNKFQGFDQNNGKVASQLYNCTSYGNGGIGFHFSYQSSLNIKHVLKNNISFQDKSAISSTPSWIQSNNTWNGKAATTASFASLTNTGVDGARQSDGSLPNLQFLHLSAASNLINAGISIVNLLFSGTAPDLGAFEYGGASTSNQAPVANAGSNRTITLPTNSTTLSGSSSKDPDGSISSYAWTKASGPSQGSITSPSAVTTTATGLVQGTYVFKLTVKDNSSATASASVTVTVNAATSSSSTSTLNVAPIANAGSDRTISTSSVALDGSASKDPDGSITAYKWTKLYTGSGTIANSTASKTSVTGLPVGRTSIFQLTVTDNKGKTASTQVKITVKSGARTATSTDLPEDSTISSEPVVIGKTSPQMKLYPNPASDIINAEITNSSIGLVTLNIYDLNGRLVKKMELNKQLPGGNADQGALSGDANSVSPGAAYLTVPVTISTLTRGVYVMETIIDKTVRMTSKFVKY